MRRHGPVIAHCTDSEDFPREHYCRDDWLQVGRVMSILEHNYAVIDGEGEGAMRSKAAVN